jgi:sister chromatid cohesion protein DCC1
VCLSEVHILTQLFQGEYIHQSGTSGTTVTYFSRSNLSTDPLSRFNELFLTRPKWTEDDIVAFIEDIAVDKKDCDRLLLKFARRAAGADGKVYYSSRTGI